MYTHPHSQIRTYIFRHSMYWLYKRQEWEWKERDEHFVLVKRAGEAVLYTTYELQDVNMHILVAPVYAHPVWWYMCVALALLPLFLLFAHENYSCTNNKQMVTILKLSTHWHVHKQVLPEFLGSLDETPSLPNSVIIESKRKLQVKLMLQSINILISSRIQAGVITNYTHHSRMNQDR